jgi:hypothetical protein
VRHIEVALDFFAGVNVYRRAAMLPFEDLLRPSVFDTRVNLVDTGLQTEFEATELNRSEPSLQIEPNSVEGCCPLGCDVAITGEEVERDRAIPYLIVNQILQVSSEWVAGQKAGAQLCAPVVEANVCDFRNTRFTLDL